MKPIASIPTQSHKQTEFLFLIEGIQGTDGINILADLDKLLIERKTPEQVKDFDLYKKLILKNFHDDESFDEEWYDSYHPISHISDEKVFEFGVRIDVEFSKKIKTDILIKIFFPIVEEYCKKKNLTIVKKLYLDIYETATAHIF